MDITLGLTESFAPIEQYQTRGNFGAWTDVYALAATLYTLVTKEVPFPSRFRTHAELPSPKQHNPELSDRINEAILKGMELEPGDRPDSVKAWLELLKPSIATITLPSTQIITHDNSGVLESVADFLDHDLEQRKANEVEVEDIGFKLLEDLLDRDSVQRKEVVLSREQKQARYFTEDLGNSINLDMVVIPGGTFMMGSPENEKNGISNQKPQHRVTVPDFYMGKFQVTQKQWSRVAKLPQIARELKENPSYFKGEKLPVSRVSWDDAIEFCARLSQATRKEYRLPSEAEWEYACRAKTITPFYYGEAITSDLANYSGIYQRTTPVGSFPPNAFGLYDMHGNVWEWCRDNWHENYQGAPSDGSAWIDKNSNIFVLRGGSWVSLPNTCRSAYRLRYARDLINYDYGFRCVVSRTS